MRTIERTKPEAFDDDEETDGIKDAIRRLDRHITALRGLEQLLALVDRVRVPTGSVPFGCVPDLLGVIITDLDRCRDEIYIAHKPEEAA